MTAPVSVPSVQPDDPNDVRFAQRASGLLAEFNQAGLLTAADVHVATRLAELGGEGDEQVRLAVAFAVRAVRHGSVCIDLSTVPESIAIESDEQTDGHEPARTDLPWPQPDAWLAACQASPLVAEGLDAAVRPVRLVDGLLYLDRYWRDEETIRDGLDERLCRPGPSVDMERLGEAARRLFPRPAPDRQRLAALLAAVGWVCVLAGGPGTGKTTTVARLLALLLDQPGSSPRIALAAPTGKAAARLQEAVQNEVARLDEAERARLGALTASTLHRLLGWRPDARSRFRHDRDNRLPYDLVVVDETSMVSLTMMSRLVEALRPDARLVLLGDPDQLASVEAGAVLGDLVARPVTAAAADAGQARAALLAELAGADLAAGETAEQLASSGVVRLTHTWRFGGAISLLAEAVRAGDSAAALSVLSSGDEHPAGRVEFVSVEADSAVPDEAALAGLRADVVAAASGVVEAAASGDAALALARLDGHRLLCAHRSGRFGVSWWSRTVRRWVAGELPDLADALTADDWYCGQPLLVTANDYELRLFNGDVGVVVDGGSRGLLAAFARGDGLLLVPPSRLSGVTTVHAMTVHRAQGSQFNRVTLLLPPPDSPLLTRELLYTAVTRARAAARVIGSAGAVATAVDRPIVRASGLRRPR